MVTSSAHISMINAAAKNTTGCLETDREKSCNPLTGRCKDAFRAHEINKCKKNLYGKQCGADSSSWRCVILTVCLYVDKMHSQECPTSLHSGVQRVEGSRITRRCPPPIAPPHLFFSLPPRSSLTCPPLLTLPPGRRWSQRKGWRQCSNR